MKTTIPFRIKFGGTLVGRFLSDSSELKSFLQPVLAKNKVTEININNKYDYDLSYEVNPEAVVPKEISELGK